jgi:hypothetical protein
MKPAAIALRIGELELEGIDPAGRFDVARGLEQELLRLLTEGGVPPRLLSGDAGTPPLVQAGALAPGDLGRALARALYEGWQ